MKKVVIILVVCFFIFLGYEFYTKNNFFKKNEDIFYGNVDTRIADLSFRFLGQITQILKEEGYNVKKGDELVILDNSYLKNQIKNINAKIMLEKIKLLKLESGYRREEIEQAKASLEVSKANLAEAENTFKRQKRLKMLNATSEENFMNSKTRFDAMKANLDLSKANLDLLQNGYQKEDIDAQKQLVKSLEINLEGIYLDLNNTIIRSPFNGILQKRYKEIGSIVNANEPVVEVARTDKFFVRAYIDEKNLGKIRVGGKMKIYSDARSKPYHGYISFISSMAEFTPKNIQTQELRADLVYRFKVEITDFDDKLKQGMPVNLKIDDDKSN